MSGKIKANGREVDSQFGFKVDKTGELESVTLTLTAVEDGIITIPAEIFYGWVGQIRSKQRKLGFGP